MINSSNNVYILCDGQSIEEMKETLDLLINKYKESNFYYEYWKDRTGKEEYYALVDSDEEEMSEFIEDCRKKAKEKFKEAKETLNKIRDIEENIREKDPKSTLNKQEKF